MSKQHVWFIGNGLSIGSKANLFPQAIGTWPAWSMSVYTPKMQFVTNPAYQRELRMRHTVKISEELVDYLETTHGHTKNWCNKENSCQNTWTNTHHYSTHVFRKSSKTIPPQSEVFNGEVRGSTYHWGAANCTPQHWPVARSSAWSCVDGGRDNSTLGRKNDGHNSLETEHFENPLENKFPKCKATFQHREKFDFVPSARVSYQQDSTSKTLKADTSTSAIVETRNNSRIPNTIVTNATPIAVVDVPVLA
jgi:hypothetical protein